MRVRFLRNLKPSLDTLSTDYSPLCLIPEASQPCLGRSLVSQVLLLCEVSCNRREDTPVVHDSGEFSGVVKRFCSRQKTATIAIGGMAAIAGASGVRFGRAILLARGAEGVASSVNFYHNALGMTILRHTDEWAELSCGMNTDASLAAAAMFRLSIKAVESEAQLSRGYGPFLSFDVDDMDGAVARCATMGGHLDGPIQYPAHGKVAALRDPDGHMIALYEAVV